MSTWVDHDAPWIVSFGGGLNSSGMLGLMRERGLRPDLIVFADTMGERPETYSHIQRLDEWCARVDFPRVVRVVQRWPKAGYTSLEDQCLRKEDLPSRAYGFSTCAYDWKLRPFWKYVREWMALLSLPANLKPWKLVGFDGGEERRVKMSEDEVCRIGYPLIDWDIDRAGCRAACERMGMPDVPKSSCFFCPSMKKHEILDLGAKHPDLLERALRIERTGVTGVARSAKGLGRSWNWGEFIAADEAARACYRDGPVESCTLCADEYDEAA